MQICDRCPIRTDSRVKQIKSFSPSLHVKPQCYQRKQWYTFINNGVDLHWVLCSQRSSSSLFPKTKLNREGATTSSSIFLLNFYFNVYFFFKVTLLFTFSIIKNTYLFGTGSSDFGSLGIVVGSLNQMRSRKCPFSLGTEFGGSGFSLEPWPQAFVYSSHSQ